MSQFSKDIVQYQASYLQLQHLSTFMSYKRYISTVVIIWNKRVASKPVIFLLLSDIIYCLQYKNCYFFILSFFPVNIIKKNVSGFQHCNFNVLMTCCAIIFRLLMSFLLLKMENNFLLDVRTQGWIHRFHNGDVINSQKLDDRVSHRYLMKYPCSKPDNYFLIMSIAHVVLYIWIVI